jgi:hypothetical protein
LSNELINFFIQIPPPERARMNKVDIGRPDLRDILVFGELQSVVIGYGMDLVSIMGELLEKQ